MNDLKEIGGFIVSADPFVQHDTSMSGNGTVNSPLGVVPGYNETVLFDVSSGQTTGYVSESITGFDKFSITLTGSLNSCNYFVGPGLSGVYHCFESTIGADNSTHITPSRIYFNANNSWWLESYDYYAAKKNAAVTWYGNGSGHLKVVKIVGINRKQ